MGDVNVIVLTNGNPMGLQLLLESIDTFWTTHPMVRVVVNDVFSKPYHDIADRYLMETVDVVWAPRSNKNMLLNVLYDDFDYTLFLTENNVLVRPFSPSGCGILNKKEVLCFSYLNGLNVTSPQGGDVISHYNYQSMSPYHTYRHKDQQIPFFNTDWAYSGAAYRTSDIKRWVNEIGDSKTILELIRKFGDLSINKQLIGLYPTSSMVINSCKFEWDERKKLNIAPYLFLDNDHYVANVNNELIWRG